MVCVCLSYCLVCSLQPCGHLFGEGSLVCDVFLCFVIFPYGVLVKVWYLIGPIPDLCLLPYIVYTLREHTLIHSSRIVSRILISANSRPS